MKRLSDFDKFAYLLLPLILHVAIREMQKYQNPENQIWHYKYLLWCSFRLFFIIFGFLIFLLLCLIFGLKFYVVIKCSSEVKVYLVGVVPSRHLLVQRHQWKHQKKKIGYLFKVNIKVVLVSFLLTLNRFHTSTLNKRITVG